MLSTAELLDALHRLPLLDAAKLAELHRQLQGRSIGADVVASKLVERGWLTGYQAERLLAGCGQELLVGSYVVRDCLGKGGMGAVYKARHTTLERLAAVKVIRNEYLHSAEATERFKREARAAAQLEHPNVVQVYDAAEAGGVHYIAMKYVEGTDLAKLIKQRGRLDVALACEYIRQAALGLQHLHEHGLVHRDIKPSNLLLQQAAAGQSEADRIVKIVDLGLVRFQPGVDANRPDTMTERGVTLGTPDFLAPEQALDARGVDIRADLYSLGCTLYYLLTAAVPFPEDTLAQKIAGHLGRDPTPIDFRRPDVPTSVLGVVRKLMAKRVVDRYQTPAEVAEALAELARGLPNASSAKLPPQSSSDTLGSGQVTEKRTPTWSGRARAGQRTPMLVALGIVLALGIGSCMILLAWKPWITTSGPASPTTAQPAYQSPAESPTASTNTIGMEFVWIKPGSFDMGSPEGELGRENDEVLHRVTLTKGFWMQSALVSQKQWKAVMGADNNPSRFKADDLPVDTVSWNDAQSFLARLNDKESRQHQAQKYRLPHEWEWEYAARAGTRTPFWQGKTITTETANFDGSHPYRDSDPRGEYRMTTTPVKKFRPNNWGLYDMGGNLWHWCEDSYAEYSRKAITDPQSQQKGSRRVHRGGCWSSHGRQCRAATRSSNAPGDRLSTAGFRVVLPAGARAPGTAHE
jgi:serine/threonine-protein kinase